MLATKSSSAGARSEKHRKSHKLVQTWVSPEMKKVLVALAKGEGRTVANFVRRELSKITGISE
jgi:predicted DNA-binding protein